MKFEFKATEKVAKLVEEALADQARQATQAKEYCRIRMVRINLQLGKLEGMLLPVDAAEAVKEIREEVDEFFYS